MSERPLAIKAAAAPLRAKSTNYPEPFASMVAGRAKRPLGDLFGLTNFGVNLTRLAPGAISALQHRHSRQDEFIFVLEGTPTLHLGQERVRLAPGMCAGFPAGGEAHHLANDSDADVLYLEIGDRTSGDTAEYPDDDLAARLGPDGRWQFLHKDGRPYDKAG